MATILFVHGTGVRDASYAATMSRIREQAALRDKGLSVQGCYWGGSCGARLPEVPRSIPAYDTTMAAGGVTDADAQLALWEALLQDPLFELRLMVQVRAQKAPLPPNQKPPAMILVEKVKALDRADAVLGAIRDAGLEPFWPAALEALVGDGAFDEAMQSSVAGTGAHRVAIARACSAMMMREAMDLYLPQPTAALRDGIVDRITGFLGGREMGVLDYVTKPLYGMAARFGTWKMRRNRGKYTHDSFEALGDILLYQARGVLVRNFIRKSIESLAPDAKRPLVVIAHSLGGIACVDLLAERDPPPVAALVTAGSQAPFLYEIGALSSLAYGEGLPSSFPQWLNFYDLNDPLSYIGEKVFQGKIKDCRIASGQPFPASHSAYWLNDKFWDALLPFVHGIPA